MPASSNLLDAAANCSFDMYQLWTADTLKTKVIAFWQAIQSSFDEGTPGDRPIGDWISIIAASAPNILPFVQPVIGGLWPAGNYGQGTETTFQLAVRYIYRICKFAYYYNNDGFITNAQAQVILDAYNAQLASP